MKLTRSQQAVEWAKKNPEKRKVIKDRYRDKHPERYILKAARDNSKKSGVEFSLQEEDIIIPDVCPVFKVPMLPRTRYAPSIDRIDSSKGYTKDNIQIISRKANVMKNDATYEELKLFAEWIINVDPSSRT